MKITINKKQTEATINISVPAMHALSMLLYPYVRDIDTLDSDIRYLTKLNQETKGDLAHIWTAGLQNTIDGVKYELVDLADTLFAKATEILPPDPKHLISFDYPTAEWPHKCTRRIVDVKRETPSFYEGIDLNKEAFRRFSKSKMRRLVRMS